MDLFAIFLIMVDFKNKHKSKIMKKIILLLLLTITTSLLSQNFVYDREEKIDTVQGETYTIHYSQKKRQPIYIYFYYTCSKQDTCYNRNNYSFYADRTIKTSSSIDYKDNREYDRGHMIPVEAVCCDRNLLKQSFSYLNICFQNSSLNRGYWKKLESIEKRLAGVEGNLVEVEIEVIYSGGKLNKQMTCEIPTGFYRTVYLNQKVLKKYYFPNTEPTWPSLKNYERELN